MNQPLPAHVVPVRVPKWKHREDCSAQLLSDAPASRQERAIYCDVTDGSRILLVEDDPALARALVLALEQDRWPVDHVSKLADAFEAILQRSYRVILLDRGLPDGDGVTLVAAARSRTPRPSILFVTARDDVSDRIEGLDAGADDYLVKPFSVAELHARVRAACRRPVDPGDRTIIEAGRLSFDPVSREVRISGRPLALPRRELALLVIMISAAST